MIAHNKAHPPFHANDPEPRDRVVFYCTRMNAHLKTLKSTTERRLWLDKEFANWTALYERYSAMATSKHYVQDPDMPSALDYACTLSEIEIRRQRLNCSPCGNEP